MVISFKNRKTLFDVIDHVFPFRMISCCYLTLYNYGVVNLPKLNEFFFHFQNLKRSKNLENLTEKTPVVVLEHGFLFQMTPVLYP